MAEIDFSNNLATTPLLTKKVTLLDGQTETEVLKLYANPIVNIYIPHNFTGSQLSFKVETELGSNNYFDYYNESGLKIIITALTKNIIIALAPIDFANVTRCKIVSNVIQAGNADFVITTRRVA